ncbi:MAG: hypothetical protein HS115_15365 [Spirochaetales bacterium]|nr:hypothetical protein [Spirochaetales bacterium]
MRPILASLFAGALLFLLTRLNFLHWPFFWPDEALFSSPAIELARNGRMGTAVLAGLIPGIGEVTLWNAPLFMVLLGFLYSFTGESLLVMRSFSLLLGVGVLYVLAELLERLRFKSGYIFGIPILLVLDLTFSRAANTGRMDMLTLLFLVLAFRQLLLIYYAVEPNTSRRLFWSGLYGGMAVISHPGGAMITVLYGIFLYRQSKKLLFVLLGFSLPLLGWALYIIPHFAEFELQFLSQIVRKAGMLQAAAGQSDTGGILVVFLSQFGSSRLLMFAAGLVFSLILIFGAVSLRRQKTALPLYVSFVAILAMVLSGSEAWYAVYVGPFVVIFIADLDRHWSRWWHRLPLCAMALFATGSTLTYSVRELLRETDRAIGPFMENITAATASCRSVYMRLRPDPYFHLRESRPDLELLEFIPGKLYYPGIEGRLKERFASIDCFLLDENDSWEPILHQYIRSESFQTFAVEAPPPLRSVRLLRRPGVQSP